jgi:hypothetical protein
MPILMCKPDLPQFFEVLSRVPLQLFSWNFEMTLERIHDALKSDSSGAHFDRYPYAGGDSVEAIAEALFDVEKHRSVFGISGADLWRN